MDTIERQLREVDDWDRKAMEALAGVVPEVEDQQERALQREQEARDKALAVYVGSLLGVKVPPSAVEDGVLCVGGYRFVNGSDGAALAKRCSLTGRLGRSRTLASKDDLAKEIRHFEAYCADKCPLKSGLTRWSLRGRLKNRGQLCPFLDWHRDDCFGWGALWAIWMVGGGVLSLVGGVWSAVHVGIEWDTSWVWWGIWCVPQVLIGLLAAATYRWPEFSE